MTIFTEFMDMLDRLGIRPRGTSQERFMKERDLMIDLEDVSDFPVEKLPQIEAWAKEMKVRNPYTAIKEMSARLSQGLTNGPVPEYDDDFIVEAFTKRLEQACKCDAPSCVEHRELLGKVLA